MSPPPDRFHTRVAWVFFALGIVLGIGWPIACAVNWDDVVESHARLGYLIGDVGIVVPLCFAVWHGLRRSRPWSRPMLLVLCGASAYDLLHFGIFLIQEEFLLPWPVYVVMIVGGLAILAWIVARELREARVAGSH